MAGKAFEDAGEPGLARGGQGLDQVVADPADAHGHVEPVGSVDELLPLQGFQYVSFLDMGLPRRSGESRTGPAYQSVRTTGSYRRRSES